MTKLQWAVIAAAAALFFLLYFGCDRQPPDMAALEETRSLSVESTTPEVLLEEAKSELQPVELSTLAPLEQRAQEAESDTARMGAYRQLSSEWYQLGQPAIAGYYAQRVAELADTEESWSIAGTTYSICIQRSEREKVREFCTGRAIRAFESAIAINPENTAHRVNLALAYTSNPPPDNPMKGVLMLRELNQEQPDNVLVLNALGRLAIRTGQYDKAVERLESARSVEPDNRNTNCLLAQAYKGKGESTQAKAFAEKCRSLSQ